MTATTVRMGAVQRRSLREVYVISIGHALTHWYPATFYLLLPLIGKELGLSYGEIGSILTCQYAAGAIANVPGGIFVDTVGRKGLLMALSLLLDRHSLSHHGALARLLDDPRLRDAGRDRQQSLASHRDPVARRPLPRAQGPGHVVSRHGRQCRRRRRAARHRLAAADLQLAQRRLHERRARHCRRRDSSWSMSAACKWPMSAPASPNSSRRN